MRLKEFTAMVDCHDLTFGYSDDGSVYRRGNESLKAIMEAAKSLRQEDVVRVWNEKVARVCGIDTPGYEMYKWRVDNIENKG